MAIIIGLLLIVISNTHLYGQDPGHWQLTEEDGLPSMTIYRMIQDDQGYIWMATANGICRYDGKEFKTFSKKGLKDGEILKIIQGPHGRIWFRNLSGQLGYIKDQGLVLFEELTNQEEINVIDFDFTEDKLYIAEFLPHDTNGKQAVVHQYDILENGDLTQKKLLFKSLSSISEFFRNEHKLYTRFSEIDKNETHFLTIDLKTNEKKFIEEFRPSYSLIYATEQQENERIISYSYGDNMVMEEGENFSQKIIKLPIYNKFIFTKKIADTYYILSKNGILIGQNPPFDPKDFKLKNYSCNTLLIDQEGNHWIGTTSQGIVVIPFPFTNLFTAENSKLQNNQVNKLFIDKENDRLLVGHSRAQISIINNDYSISNTQFKSSGKITKIYKDRENKYWVASSLNSFYGKSLQNNVKSPINGFKTVFEDTNNNLWIGNSYSIHRFPKNLWKGKIKDLKITTGTLVARHRTYAIFEDNNKTIWFGTSRGLYFKSPNGVLQPFLESDEHVPYNISNIYQDPNGIIWITTLGDGVLGIKDKKVVHHFNLTNGFPSNTFRSVFVHKTDLWLGSDNGISIYNFNDQSIRKIDKTDGLPSNDITDMVLWKDNVWIGTNYGLAKLPLDISTLNTVHPTINLTALKIWDRDTTLMDSISLHHSKNNLQLEFTGIGYRAQGNISYRYRLDGIDKEWISTQNRIVRYPDLNPGNYKFEVYSINEDGVSSKSPATLQIKVSTPFWKTWWFRILSILLLVGGSGLIINARTQRQRDKEKREHEFKEKMNELKQQALQTQMNPHFIFNSLNAIQQFITTNEREPALLYLSSFAKLVRLIFEHSKKKVISFDEEIEFLELYLKLEKLRFKEKVDIDFQLHDNLESESYQIKVPPLLFQPLIENSFKHGLFHKKNKGSLKINFKKENEYLVCTIEDDGVGRAKAAQLNHWKTKKYESSGIKTAQERLAILNKIDDPKDISSVEITDLFDENKKASGTRVRVQIKY